LGNGVLEQDAVLRDAVDAGCFDFWIAVTVQVIGAQRVDRDHDKVEGT
jgi:hypothetical protein